MSGGDGDPRSQREQCAARRTAWRWGPCLSIVLLLAAGCATPWQRVDHKAERQGFSKAYLRGAGFDHVLYRREGEVAAGPWIVFLEGDGLPWRARTRVSDDPTPRDPLTLDLAAATPGRVVYLARPCYQGLADAPGCRPELWTSARYGRAVVDSLVAALDQITVDERERGVWLVGYSGGGVLAVLVAARLPYATRVVTVAANLDVEGWAAAHGYAPLDGSLNPQTESPLRASLRQAHLFGELDTNVAAGTAERFAARQPNARAIGFAEFDHRCCWREQWPLIGDSLITAGAPPGANATSPNLSRSSRRFSRGAQHAIDVAIG